jgi:hypothetical protein
VYLAIEKIGGHTRYLIRESYRDADYFLSRDLIDLGVDPGGYIVYPGGNSFYIDQMIEDRLTNMGIEADPDEIEDIFWPFVHPEIQRVLEPFRGREKRHQAIRQKKRPTISIDTQLHIFDKRRMHYLRFGRMDQKGIGRLPLKFFQILHNKSRDEIEQTFMAMETELALREYKNYVYVVFELQQFFYQTYAKNAPQTLNADKVDEHFVEQICRLNSDRSFWAGMKTDDSLHNYLVRYVLMYFDHDFASRSFMEDYIRQFVNNHRDHPATYRTNVAILKKASAVFGESQETLKEMSRQEIASLYRLKAMKLHPDKGGDHDQFVNLTAAYHELLKTKK